MEPRKSIVSNRRSMARRLDPAETSQDVPCNLACAGLNYQRLQSLNVSTSDGGTTGYSMNAEIPRQDQAAMSISHYIV
jgi:hypothetical protein